MNKHACCCTVFVFRFILLILSAFSVPALALGPKPADSQVPARPNILLMLVDDMGYSDLGCYGSEIPTPNLDQLAAGGLRFSQFYNTARCCPTRASLLTGLHPHQTGVGHMTYSTPHQAYKGEINNQCVTIAEVLRPSGYNTYISGKWHVTLNKNHNQPQHAWPLQRGFDRYYGMIYGADHYFKPAHLSRGNEKVEYDNDPQYEPESYYITDAFTDHAIRFITDHKKERGDKPFFLYLAYNTPHWPLHAKPEDVEKFVGKYMHGWDKLRQSRRQKQIDMGLLEGHWKLSDRTEGIRPWNRLDEKIQKEMDYRMAVYAAQVYNMDYNIGKVVDTLKKLDRLDNTLILFLSDNGGCAEGGELGGGKFKQVNKPDEKQLYISYGRGWANASNTPFRRFKHFAHEGGISTPLIVHWPDGIRKKLRNTFVHQPGFLPDVMATCVDVAGADYPDEYNGNKILPMQGISLAPVCEGKPLNRSTSLFWEHEGNRAAHDGKWKIVSFNKKPWQLYDLQVDRTETNDLAAQHPDIVKRMGDQWQRWADQVGVKPYPVKKKKKRK